MWLKGGLISEGIFIPSSNSLKIYLVWDHPFIKSHYNDQFCLLSVLPKPRKAQKCASKVNKYRDIISQLAKGLKDKTISYSSK